MKVKEKEKAQVNLDNFKGKFCKIVFVEEGQEQLQKGEVTDVDEHFIYLKTYQNLYAIGLKDIIKIKTGAGE